MTRCGRLLKGFFGGDTLVKKIDAARYRRTRPPVWGTGGVLDQEFSFAYLVDHVREFLDALGIKKANFVGHSMGGWLVTLLAYESPNRVNKLVNATGGGTATRPLQMMVEFKVPSPAQIRQQLADRYTPGRVDVEEIAATFIKKNDLPGHAEAFAGVMRHMTNPITRQRYNTLRRMPYIEAPTLVVWGRDDEVNSLEMGEATARAISGARLEVFDHTGRMLPQQRPDEFNHLVLDFLTAWFARGRAQRAPTYPFVWDVHGNTRPNPNPRGTRARRA